MNLSNKLTGNLAMIIYALVTAVSSIVIHATTQEITPLLSACNTFLFCLLVYSAISFSTFSKIALIKNHAYSIFMLNVTTAICWIFTFLSLKYLPPELYLFTYLCAMPISAAILFRNKILKSIMLSVGLILLIYTYHNSKLFLGLLLAFVGGSSGTVYSIYSKRIVNAFTTMEILSLRFYLTVIVTFLLCIFLNEWKILTPVDYSEFAVLSLISVIVPLTLFQVGLKNLTIVKALSFMPLAPLVCYLINFTLGHGEFNGMQMSAVFFLFVAMFI
ncbi:MAG: EamA family transporter [Gammaproteobacteria bacterium]|nr:EamA family transporter [Gammaproteobacteria bacterium]